MRYSGPLPFPVKTLGDLWDLPPGVEGLRLELERDEERLEEAWQERDHAEDQATAANRLIDELETALGNATRLEEFRPDFKRIVDRSGFERW